MLDEETIRKPEEDLELEPWELDCWFPLRDGKGEITGRLHVNVSWRPEVKVHDDELLQVP
jgi:hypothetical protein